MSSVKTLHSAAMEFFDLGKIARAKGHEDTYEDYLHKAYTIAMEAALRSQIDLKSNDPLQAIYLRSVSWLAYDAGHLKEARLWGEIALQNTPNSYEKESLEKLLQKINKEQKEIPTKTALFGVLISINLEENKIFIRQNDAHLAQMILLPNSFFQKIIPFFIGQAVKVEYAKEAGKDDLILSDIRLAA